MSAVLLLSVSLVVKGVMARHGGQAVADARSQGREMALALAAFTVYLVALPYAGFIIASVLFFAVLMHLYGCRNKLMIGGASIAIPVTLFVIFRYAFQIILPRGVLAF